MLPSKTPATMILLLLAACNGTPDPIGDGIGGDSSTTGETMLTSTGGPLSGTGILEESTGEPSSASTGQGGSGSGSDESTGDLGCRYLVDDVCMCGLVQVHPSICGCEDVSGADDSSGDDVSCACDNGVFEGSCTESCYSTHNTACACDWGPGIPTIDCDCYVSDFGDCVCNDGLSVFPREVCG